jgi:hypothetical protein
LRLPPGRKIQAAANSPRAEPLQKHGAVCLLPDDGIRRGQLLLQCQTELRLAEARAAFAAGEFDDVELNFIAVNHKFILLEIREIAKGDSTPLAGQNPPVRTLTLRCVTLKFSK